MIGPSFLLGAVASFISMLLARMGSVLDRVRFVNALGDGDLQGARLKDDLPRLHVRVKRLHWSILLAICAGMVTTLLIMIAFLMAFASIHHGEATAILFIAALGFFFASLCFLAMEVLIAVSDYDHY